MISNANIGNGDGDSDAVVVVVGDEKFSVSREVACTSGVFSTMLEDDNAAPEEIPVGKLTVSQMRAALIVMDAIVKTPETFSEFADPMPNEPVHRHMARAHELLKIFDYLDVRSAVNVLHTLFVSMFARARTVDDVINMWFDPDVYATLDDNEAKRIYNMCAKCFHMHLQL